MNRNCSTTEFLSFLNKTDFFSGDKQYVENLKILINDYPKFPLSFNQTFYEFKLDEVFYRVQFFDIKIKFCHNEDEIIQDLYKKWELNYECQCPFRRGMCIGDIFFQSESYIDEPYIGTHSFVSVGTVKFFYKDSNENINDKIIITEKANGEFSMCTVITDLTKREREWDWILVGSKNVRIVLPLKNTMEIYNKIIPKSEIGSRYSYLKTMLELWLKKLNNDFLLNECKNFTILGEQIGVHNHIYTNYKKQDILIFGLIDKTTHSQNTNIEKLTLLQKNGISTVGNKTITDINIIEDELLKISLGSIEEYGEGSVIYYKNKMFKLKNENYFFIRAIRTKLEAFIGKLNKNPEISLNLHGEIKLLMEKIKSRHFPNVSKEISVSWFETIPRMILFLIRHRLTIVTSNFSDNFIKIFEYLKKHPDKYLIPSDLILEEMKSIANLKINSSERNINEIVDELTKEIISFKPNIFAFSMKPGSGKTKLFKEIRIKLIEMKIFHDVKIFERDFYQKKYSNFDTINNHWYNDIKTFIIDDSNNLALVGNCFHKNYAKNFHNEINIHDKMKTKMLIARLKQEELNHPDYSIICLKRLLNRNENHDDDSTLIMNTGAYTVCNKFFNTDPIENGLKILTFNSINLNEIIPEYKIKIENFKNLFKKNKLRNKFKTTLNLIDKPILIGTEIQNIDLFFKLSNLGSDLLEKSDFHITLIFKPTKEEIEKFELGKTIKFVGTDLITISNDKHFMQFISLNSKNLHITLGTTNNSIMPCSLGFDYFENNLNNKFQITIEKLNSPIEYEGVIKLFYY